MPLFCLYLYETRLLHLYGVHLHVEPHKVILTPLVAMRRNNHTVWSRLYRAPREDTFSPRSNYPPDRTDPVRLSSGTGPVLLIRPRPQSSVSVASAVTPTLCAAAVKAGWKELWEAPDFNFLAAYYTTRFLTFKRRRNLRCGIQTQPHQDATRYPRCFARIDAEVVTTITDDPLLFRSIPPEQHWQFALTHCAWHGGCGRGRRSIVLGGLSARNKHEYHQQVARDTVC